MKTEIEALCEQLHAAVEALPDNIMPYDVRMQRTLNRASLVMSAMVEQMQAALEPATSAILNFAKFFTPRD